MLVLYFILITFNSLVSPSWKRYNRWPLGPAHGLYWGPMEYNVHIRREPQNNERMWPDLMNHVVFSINTHEWVCVHLAHMTKDTTWLFPWGCAQGGEIGCCWSLSKYHPHQCQYIGFPEERDLVLRSSVWFTSLFGGFYCCERLVRVYFARASFYLSKHLKSICMTTQSTCWWPSENSWLAYFTIIQLSSGVFTTTVLIKPSSSLSSSYVGITKRQELLLSLRKKWTSRYKCD